MKRFHRSLEETPWRQPASFPDKPTRDQLHVWRLKVTDDENELTKARRVLSKDEIAKADRYHFARDRNCCVMARAALRTLAGNYLKKNPEFINIGLEANGKPQLLEADNELSCNLSHSAGWIVLAFGDKTALGVDIEGVNPEVEVENIVGNFFSRLEVPLIMSQPPERRADAFFFAWTRKEALIKATGEGLSLPLNEFGVSILPQQELKVLHTDWEPQEADEWALVSFMVAPDLPGAVARKGVIGEVRFFDLEM
ncbi:hypothetical protein CEQ90_06590 [Lewinellaceae bacterium SD302]|nr:hypothetical protein CEQ90_06590 [Lewinellaceae bacterium SD302]